MKSFIMYALWISTALIQISGTYAIAAGDVHPPQETPSGQSTPQPLYGLLQRLFHKLEKQIKEVDEKQTVKLDQIIKQWEIDHRSCRPGFISKGYSCYRFHVTSGMDWEMAAKHCKALGAHLLYIETPEKQKQIWKVIADRGLEKESWWIGAKYTTYATTNTSSWAWQPAGTPVTYFKTRGLHGRPDYCIALDGKYQNEWFKQPCKWTKRFICEM